MTGQTGRRIPPIVMGHEAAGVVEAVGAAVTRFKKGDRITFDSTIYCNHCRYCLSGKPNLCSNRKVLGVSCDEYRQDGAMADFVVVPEHIVCLLPEGLAFEKAAMVEPVSIAVHAVERAGIHLGDSVVVIGCGIIGLLTIQAARLAGAGQVIAVDLVDYKLEEARRLGADHAVNSKKTDAVEAIRALTGGEGADVSLEAVGFAQTVDIAVRSVRKGGRCVMIGNLTPKGEFPLQVVVQRELDVRGTVASAGEYPACLTLIASGRLDVDRASSARSFRWRRRPTGSTSCTRARSGSSRSSSSPERRRAPRHRGERRLTCPATSLTSQAVSRSSPGAAAGSAATWHWRSRGRAPISSSLPAPRGTATPPSPRSGAWGERRAPVPWT